MPLLLGCPKMHQSGENAEANSPLWLKLATEELHPVIFFVLTVLTVAGRVVTTLFAFLV